MYNIRINDLGQEIFNYEICEGVRRDLGGSRKPFVQWETDISDENNIHGFNGKKYYRPENCELLSKGRVCRNCSAFLEKLDKKEKKSIQAPNKPLHPNTPLSTVNPARLIASLKEERKKNKQLREFIEKSGVLVDTNVDADISSILEHHYQSLSPFVKLFWEEQKKYFESSPSGRRYHPMIIRYALCLATKSPAVYEEIRDSGILK